MPRINALLYRHCLSRRRRSKVKLKEDYGEKVSIGGRSYFVPLKQTEPTVLILWLLYRNLTAPNSVDFGGKFGVRKYHPLNI